MTDRLRLMVIVAHPDDESLGTGGTLAKYADEGIETYLVTATRGERGWNGPQDEYPGLEGLGKIREAELLAAAKILGLQDVTLLDYIDGDLDQADPQEILPKIVRQIRRVKPQVVITFAPDGAYGHPDHIAISQFTGAAIVYAAAADYAPCADMPPHQVAKLYYRVSTKEEMLAYQSAFGDLVMNIDGVERRAAFWPDWNITTHISTAGYGQKIWEAISCHCSQLPSYNKLKDLPPEFHEALWAHQGYYRAYSLINGGRVVEQDLFEGLR